MRSRLANLPEPGVEIAVLGTDRTTTSDAAGAFTLAGLNPGERVSVRAETPGHDPQTLEAFVVENATDPLDYALAPRTWGVVSGTITDAATGQPIRLAEVRVEGSALLAAASEGDGRYDLLAVPEGTHAIEVGHPEYLPARFATVAVSGGPSATTDATSRYSLPATPAGLVSITISADGYPEATRRTGVVADREPGMPTPNTADFAIDHAGSAPPDEVSKVISASEGGFLETPDGRTRIDILPGSLTGDGRITLRSPFAPLSTPGLPLALDPALELGTVRSVGPETELVVGPPVDGGVKPLLAGPAVVSMRYSGEVAAASDVAERTAFPYLAGSSGWTVLRIVPYFHAVDRINKLIVAGLVFGETETGARVIAQRTLEKPVLIAQVGGEPPEPPPDQVLDAFDLAAGAAAKSQQADESRAIATFVDLADDDELNPTQSPRPGDLTEAGWGENRISAAARPLLVFHGWDPRNILQDNDLITNPRGIASRGGPRSARYSAILDDLVDGTDGVYRPIFVTYNSRMSVPASAGAVVKAIEEFFPFTPGGKALRIFARPGDYDANPPEAFEVWDSFGFSMGGLTERQYQSMSLGGRSLAGSPEAVGRIQNRITVGTPHHGALSNLDVSLLARLGFVGRTVLGILTDYSPGTMNLLDYRDDATCASSGNPYLCILAFHPRSVPNGQMDLVGGTKSDLKWTSGLGTALNGHVTNDIVVPLTSAFGRSHEARPQPVLAGARPQPESFDHLNAGTNTRAEGNQRISNFQNARIFPTLSDHYVVSNVVRNEVRCPEPDRDGVIDLSYEFEVNVSRGTVTGLAFVAYVQNHENQWRIAGGANPDSLQLEGVVDIAGNSDGERFETLNLQLPLDYDSGVERIFIRLFDTGEGRAPLAAERPTDAEEAGAMSCP